MDKTPSYCPSIVYLKMIRHTIVEKKYQSLSILWENMAKVS